MSAHTTSPSSANQATAQTILLVEDEALIALSEKVMLQKHGFTVLTAANGTKAVDLALHTAQLDLILMDINLGSGMDGTEAAQQILIQRDVPIVFLSSHTEPDVVAKTEKITSYGYVVKNSGETVLLASIKMAFKLFDAYQRLKQQEAALRESEGKYRRLVENIPDVVWTMDEYGNPVFISPNLEQVLGYTPADLMCTEKRSWFGQIHPDDNKRVRKAYCDLFAGQSIFDIEYRLQRKDGEWIWLHDRAITTYEQDGRRYADGVFSDICVRKQAEEALKTSEQELKRTLDATTEGIWTWDFRTNTLVFSPRYYKMLGYEPNEFPASFESWQNLIHLDDLEHTLRVASEWLAAKSDEYTNEFRLQTKAGDYRWLRATGRVVEWDEHGDPIRMIGNHEDITDRKQVEDQLTETMQRLTAHIDNSPLAVIEFDSQLRVTGWSKGAERIFGWRAEEILGRSITEIRWVYAEDVELVNRESAGILSGERYRSLHVNRNYRKDGTVIHCEWYNSAIYDTQGKLISVLSQVLDITDRKQAEEALRVSEERYRAVVESSADSIYILDSEWRHLVINQAACKFVRMTKDQLVGHKLTVLFPGIEHTPFFQTFQKVMTTRQADHVVNEYTFADGRRGWYDVTVSPVPEGILCVSRDITDRKRVEDALRESEERFNLFMQYLPGLAFIKDIEGRLIFVNAYHAKLYSLDPKEMVGQNFKNFWNPEYIAQFTEQDRMILANRQPLTSEELYPDREGPKWWLTCKFPIFQQDKLTLLGGISLDITARKQAEEALQKSEQQLRELNAQKDKFFSILAHDLKNPIVGFVSFANLLEHNFASMDSEERQTLIQYFRTSAKTLFALLENLLTWARLQQGQIEYCSDQFPLDQLVARAVDLLTPNAMHKQITLINTTPPVNAYASIEMVDTVVRNLLTNAVKFTPPGGKVTITAAQMEHNIRVTVADTGIGIPPDKLVQLFRIDGNTQRDGTNGEKGTGLGLILCKEFVEKQGGRIWAESEPGKGTRMIFTLPTQPKGSL